MKTDRGARDEDTLMASLLGQALQQRLARAVSERMLAPPVPVDDIARLLGADIIVDPTLKAAGRVETSSHGYLIRMAPHAHETHRRMVLGHEIAHMLLDDMGVPLAHQAVGGYEAACDEFARQILLPPDLLARNAGYPFDITAVMAPSRQAMVCPSVVFDQLAARSRWKAVLAGATWDRLTNRWLGTALSSSGVLDCPLSIGHGAWTDIPPAHHSALLYMAPLRLWDREMKVRSTIAISDEAAWMLADLAPIPCLAKVI